MRYSNLLRYVFGYGVPLVFSSTALLATKMMEDEDNSSESDNNDFEEHQVEGEPQYCWLSEENNFNIYFFIAPVAVILLLNCVVLFLALRVANQRRKTLTSKT